MRQIITIVAVAIFALPHCYGQERIGQMQPPLSKQKYDSGWSIQQRLKQYSQEWSGDNVSLKRLCDTLRKGLFVFDGEKPIQDYLISPIAFRRLVKQNFGDLILGNESVSKIGRYASLDVSEKPAFDFSPFTSESDIEKHNYQHIFAVNISGKLNSEDIFRIKDIRDLSLRLSFTRILNSASGYIPTDRSSNLKSQYVCDLQRQLLILCREYNQKMNDIDSTDCSDKDKLKNKLLPKFLDGYYDKEMEVSEDYWRVKKFTWFTISAGIKRDKVMFINEDTIKALHYNPQSETVVIPELLGSINHFAKHANRTQFISFWASVKAKHSLSEVYEPEKFQSYSKITDVVFMDKGSDDVFVTKFNKLDKKAVLDFGLRAVGTTAIRGKSIGASFAFSRKGLVAEASFPSLFRTEIGGVIPFRKADGESSFNLEIFHRWDIYSQFDYSNDNYWGVRFNVPISN